MTAPMALGPLIIESVDPDAMVTMSVILGDPNPIHLDPAVVQAAGLGDRVINQGPSNFGYVLTMLRDTGWSIGTFRVRLLANVFGRDRVIASGSALADQPTGPDTRGPSVTAAVGLDVDGGARAIDGTAVLWPDGLPSDLILSTAATGEPVQVLPSGQTVIEPAEQDQIEQILETGVLTPSAVGDPAHPVWAMILAMRGIGVSVDGLFEALDCSMSEGPMLGECAIEFGRPILVGRGYTVTAQVLGVQRKQGGRLGAFDLARTSFQLADDDGPAVRVDMTFVLPRRSAVPAGSADGSTR